MAYIPSMYSSYGNRRFTRNTLRILLVFAIIGCLIGIFVGHSNENSAKQLDAHFASQSGAITDKFTQSAGRGGTNYEISYHFSLQNGQAYHKTITVDASYYYSANVGNTISVVYNSQNPSQNYIQGMEPTVSGSKLVIEVSEIALAVIVVIIALSFA